MFSRFYTSVIVILILISPSIALAAINFSQSPHDQRILEATANATIDGKPVVLKNTYKYGVPKEALDSLGFRKSRVLVFEDPQGKTYFTTFTGNPNQAPDSFRPFQQLYIDGKRVTRLASDYSPKVDGNNPEFVFFEEDINFGESYAPAVEPGGTPITRPGEEGGKPINVNISGSDPNKPNIEVSDSEGKVIARNYTPTPGKKITKCSFSGENPIYCMLAPIGIFTGDKELKELGAVSIGPDGLTLFLNNLVRFAIAIATGLAVVMIVIGGVQYASTDAINGKSDGASRIKQALSGLMLAIVSYVVLETINPDVFATGLGLEESKPEVIFTPAEIQEIETADGHAEHEHGGPITNPLEVFEPTEASEAAFPGIGDYKGGAFNVKDNSNNPGTILPQVAYLRDTVPKRWKYLVPISTFRSEEHNKKIGGSATSDHLRGAAIDFAAANKKINSPEFINDGYSLMEYLKQNGSAIGVDQIIFREKNWRFQDGKWVRGGQVSGHMDHIHIGFQ